MLFGENAKIVFELVCEFRSQIRHADWDAEQIKIPGQLVDEFFKHKKGNNPRLDILCYRLNLKLIFEEFIMIENFDEEKLFNVLFEEYNRKMTKEEAELKSSIFPGVVEYEEGYWIGLENFIHYREDLMIEKNVFGFRNLKQLYVMYQNKKSENSGS